MYLPGLSEATIQDNTAPDSYRRGVVYAENGHVLSVKRRSPGEIEAFVKGSQLLPYTVRIEHDEQKITEVACTCPYFAGSWCKHIVATLLVVEASEPEEGPASVRALLEPLGRGELIDLVERLVEEQPELASWVRRQYGQPAGEL